MRVAMIKSLPFLLITIFLFLIFFPLVNSINFMQNDDWVHYRTVQRFLDGNFSLEPIIGSTFYLQGIIGTIFAKIFGLMKLPILTLIVSVLDFYVLALILNRQIKLNIFISALFGFLLFLNPLHVYSSLGFMTDNYVLFFLLLSIFFANKFAETNSLKDFLLIALISTFGFFIKQYFLIVFASFLIFLLLKRAYKFAFWQLGILLILLLFYYRFFPLTEIMKSQSPAMFRLLDLGSLYSLLFVFGICIVSMLLPMFIGIFYQWFKSESHKSFMFVLLISGILAYLMNFLFLSSNYAIKTFPYLINTFTRKGFYTFGLGGNKYHWQGFYDTFEYWELASIIVFAIGVLVLMRKYKKILSEINFTAIFCIAYTSMLIVTPTLYDRYILPLIAGGIIVFAKSYRKLDSKLFYVSIIGFLLFLSIINYQFTMDYIGWQRYVWNKSSSIAKIENIPNSVISSSHAWNSQYETISSPTFLFTFDAPDVFSNDSYKLIETKSLNFSGSLFISPNVYLYEQK